MEGALSPGFGMPLEEDELLVSFFADEGFPPFGMRLAILEFFLLDSDDDSRSSLGGELSFAGFPDLLLSSLSLDDAIDLLPFAEDFEYDDEEVLLGAVMEGVWVLGGVCLAGVLVK